MAVTLVEIEKNTQDDIQAGVIDEFRKSSFFFQTMPFDNAVTPGTSQGTLTYGYTRLTTQATAAGRDFNAEYTAQEAKKTRYTTDLKVFGGSFQVDRVFQDVGGLVDEVSFQTEQKIKAVRAKFHDLAINGDSGAVATDFDGLDVALTGSTTEYNGTKKRDWTTIDSQAEAFAELEQIDEWLSLLDGKPSAIIGNRKGINRLKFLARWAGSFTVTQDEFGRKVDNYDGIPLVDLGEKAGSTETIIPTETRTIEAASVTGLTDLYAPRLAIDGFHGVTLKNAARPGPVVPRRVPAGLPPVGRGP
jgi:hypothetical protein